jgi:hypothetical protein
VARSTAGAYIDSIRVLPNSPTENDVVKIAVYANTSSIGKKLSIVPTISAGKIEISACYNSSNVLGGMSFFADTLILGILPAGKYKITSNAYFNLGHNNPNCDNIIDSSQRTDSFYVAPLMPVTQKILPLAATENDSVKIAVSVTTPNPARKISLSYILGQNDILIKGCFAKTQPTALPQTFNDTLVIGKLQQGGYRSHVTVFYSVGDTNICDTVVDFTQLLDSFTVTKTVFVDDHRLANVAIYPNPTSSDVNILLPEGIEIEQVALQDITGRIVKTETAGRFSVADLPGGFYILQVQTNAGRFVQKLRKE